MRENEPPFPHPLTPRSEMTLAEKAFFREAIRRVKEATGHAVRMEIDDHADENDVYIYRLVARWVIDGKKNWLVGEGSTPGEALTALLAGAESVKT